MSVEITAGVPTTLVVAVGMNKLDVATGTTAKPMLTGFLTGRKTTRIRKMFQLTALQASGRGPNSKGRSGAVAQPMRACRATLRLAKPVVGIRRRSAKWSMPVYPGQSQGLPDAAELERPKRQIRRELRRLHF